MSHSRDPDEIQWLARRGEDIAANYLGDRGFEILHRNWRAGRGEIDIVAREGGVVAFVEVKTRGAGPQDPLDAVSRRQRAEIRRTAGRWIRRHPGWGAEYRFDVVGVRLRPGKTPAVEHVADAFHGEDC